VTESQPAIRIVALYHFTPFDDCAALRGPLLDICSLHGIKGTLLLAPEGINGTIAGTDAGLDMALAYIRAMPGCAGLDVKEARGPALPFKRMKVRLKREIVTMGQPNIDPRTDAGTYVPAEAWNDLITQPNTIVIDTRNDYEVAVGTFEGAINPNIKTFRDFPAWFRAHRESLLSHQSAPKIAMFCTGGIRCEKSTAFLKKEGIDAVYHLQGGILKYLETVPRAESRWQGECFVFDQRNAVDHDLKPSDDAF
jgi:UPF0176 protein